MRAAILGQREILSKNGECTPSILHVIQHNHAGSPLNIVKEILTAKVDSMATPVAMQVLTTTLLSGSTRSCQPKWTITIGIRKRIVKKS